MKLESPLDFTEVILRNVWSSENSMQIEKSRPIIKSLWSFFKHRVIFGITLFSYFIEHFERQVILIWFSYKEYESYCSYYCLSYPLCRHSYYISSIFKRPNKSDMPRMCISSLKIVTSNPVFLNLLSFRILLKTIF